MNVCSRHHSRIRRYGDPHAGGPARSAPGTPWTDPRHGYVYRTIDGSKVMEHRYVMEQMLGRLLWPDEHVHHRNGDRTDNRPENLELWSVRQPSGQRVEDKLAWAVELIQRYAPDLLAEESPGRKRRRRTSNLRLV